jgi:hypothetical protein
MNEGIRAYLASIGRKGGARSRRTLTAGQARAMVERHGDAGHGAYNALVRRIVSFSRAAGRASSSDASELSRSS